MKTKDTVANVLLLLSFMALGWGLAFSWTLLVVTAIVGWFIVKDQANIFEDLRKGFKPITGCLSLILLGLVAFRMRVNGLDLYNHIEGTDLVKFPYTFSGLSVIFLLFDMFVALLSLPSIVFIIEKLFALQPSMIVINEEESKVTRSEKIILFIVALLLMLLCSECGPLYPINLCRDNHIFYIIGDGVLHGAVPYRDLIDHKGPFFFFVHTLACIISHPSMTGAWCIEVVCSFLFLYFGFKTVRLFFKEANVWMFSVVAFVVYSTHLFQSGGAEGMCLPAYSYALYSGLKSAVDKRLPDLKTCLWIGALGSAVFWIKFTICGVFGGWFLAICFLACQQKQLKELWRISLQIVLGLAIVTAPIFFYFAHFNALWDLFKVYFGCNIFNYAQGRMVSSSLSSLGNFIQYQLPAVFEIPLLAMFATASFIFLWKLREKTTFICFSLISIVPFIFFLFVSSGYSHYYFPLVAFIIPGVLVATLLAYNYLPLLRKNHVIIAFFVLGIFFTAETNGKIADVSLKKPDIAQYRFAKIINEKEDATLLEYFCDRDSGLTPPCSFYTTCHIVPTCRYFGSTGAYPKSLQIANEDSLISVGAFDFVTTLHGDLVFDLYQCIDSLDGNYLYKRKDLEIPNY